MIYDILYIVYIYFVVFLLISSQTIIKHLLKFCIFSTFRKTYSKSYSKKLLHLDKTFIVTF